MNSKEILMVADAVSNEKGLDKETIFGAIEAALATASKKLSDTEISVRVSIDRTTGEYETFRTWEVFEDDSEDFEDPDTQIKLTYALKKNPDIKAGEFIEEPMDRLRNRLSCKKFAMPNARMWLMPFRTVLVSW